MKNFFKRIVVFILTAEAKAVLRKFKPKIVAVTGSVGKTSSKDAIYSVLSAKFRTRKSEKSFNSDIGIPLAILGLPNAWNNPFAWLANIFKGFFFSLPYTLYPKPFPSWLVLEVGADRPGDIKKISKWLAPDVVALTRFSKTPVHIEFFKNAEELVEEKGSLLGALKKDGVLVFNCDDEDAIALSKKFENKIISFGMCPEAEIKVPDYSVSYGDLPDGKAGKNGVKIPVGIHFKMEAGGNSMPVGIAGVIGRQAIYSALCASAVGFSQGMTLIEISEALQKYAPPPGRMRIISGVKNSAIIDDTYNSSPVALEEALLALKKVETAGRRIAVLGDMMELGKASVEKHIEAGKLVAGVCDIFITVGVRMRQSAESAMNNGMSEKNVFQCDDSREAGKQLEILLRAGDIALVKGSQSMRMEKVVEEVMAEPERADELLVRQDDEWRKR